jgi:hypothetical protein
MKQNYIRDYRRVSKTRAKQAYEDGLTIRMCPVKINPTNLWNYYTDINVSDVSDGNEEADFEKRVNAFIYYNCSWETGYYPAFYVRCDEMKD